MQKHNAPEIVLHSYSTLCLVMGMVYCPDADATQASIDVAKAASAAMSAIISHPKPSVANSELAHFNQRNIRNRPYCGSSFILYGIRQGST